MKLAVAGLGFMGSTHLTALRSVPQAQLVAVVSDDPVKLSGDLTKISGNLAGREGQKLDFSQVKKYRTLEQALADPDIDAVDLCLPTYLHESAAIAALAAGKHVLVEKPMAMDGPAARRMLDQAAKSGRIIMTAQVLRFWGDYQPLIEARRSARMGHCRAAVFRRRCAAPHWGKWLKDPEKGGGGVFDLLIHDVDMCVYLFGLPHSVSATGYVDLGKGIDILTGQLHYNDIPSVVVTGGWHHPASYPFSMEYTVSFDEGTFEFSSAGRPVTLYGDDGSEKQIEKSEKDGFAAELEYFADCCNNNRAPEKCPATESAAAVGIMRLLVDAREKSGDKIPCKL